MIVRTIRPLGLAFFLAVSVLVFADPAAAQVCGDADGNGNVTVTDGVQTLRAAAFLSSSCSGTVCDVDGSGTVTVTDGVNVLRKAANLPAPDACGGGGVNQQVQELINQVQPLLTIGLGFIPAGGASIQQQNICQNAPDGEAFFDEGSVEFVDCDLGGVVFDGSITSTATSVEFFLFSITDVATDSTITFDGELNFFVRGTSSFLNGSLEISSDFGDFVFAFNQIVFNQSTDVITGGSVRLEADFSDIDGLTFIEIGFTGSSVVPVTVGFDDQTTVSFSYNVNTGVLTPA